MTRLVTEWKTDDPLVADALTALAALPEWSPERLEGEAGLHMLQARWCWRDADKVREARREREARAARKAEKALTRTAGSKEDPK